jgi:hypothetical protein
VNACSICVRACAVHESSGPPQLIRVTCEVHDDLGPRRDSAHDLDVEHDLAVGVLVGAGRIGAAVDADRRDRRRGQAEAPEIGAEIGFAEAAPELDDRDGLSGAVDARGEVVGLGDLHGRVGGRLRRLSVETEMRVRLRPLVDPEHAGDDPGERGGYRERSLPSAVGAGLRMGIGPEAPRPERTGDGIHGSAQDDAPAREVHVPHIEAVLAGERAHRLDVGLLGAVGTGQLLARERASLGRGARRLGIHPVERRGRAQVRRHLDLGAGVGVADARVLGNLLALAARNRDPIL